MSIARWGHWGLWRGDIKPGPLDSQLSLGHLFLHPLLPNSTPYSCLCSNIPWNKWICSRPSQNFSEPRRLLQNIKPSLLGHEGHSESQFDTQIPRKKR